MEVQANVSEQEEVLNILRDPGSYPHPAQPFAVHQTHISWVFLAGPYAYKLKKAVDLGFLDYSTAARRRRFCEREVELNRRLAPSVYLDVVPLLRRDGRIVLAPGVDDPAHEVEAVVRMKRLPQEAMLDSLVRRGLARREHIDRLVEVLASFYASAGQVREGDGPGTPADLRRAIAGNFERTRAFIGDLVPPGRFHATRSAQLTCLTLREDVFRRRLRDGWVRDGHGDLRAEHVGFIPECVVIDCIEFNDQLRLVDIAADLAFLKMDLEFLGAADLAAYLIERFVQVTERGSGGSELGSVLDFYASYRAWVRGKVEGIMLSQPEVPAAEKEALRRRAARHFELAGFHALAFHRPLAVLVGGLSGSGKSTLAGLLAGKLGAPLLRSDEVRKELAGVAPFARGGGVLGEKLYSTEFTRRTYEALAERARALLAEGATVVLDATFSRYAERELLRAAAREAGARLAYLECRVPREAARARLERRAAAGEDVSDATPAILEAQAAAYEAPEPREARRLDASPPPEAVLEAALLSLRAST